MRFLKGAAIFLLGAGAGATGSYFYFKRKYDEKKAELNELKDHYYMKINVEADDNTKTEEIIKRAGYISYDTAKPKEVNPVIYADDKPVIVDSPPEDYPEEPILITEEDYSEKELTFEKLELEFYVGDNTLVDENDEIIDISTTIGYENLEKFISDESEDLIFIRNASSGSDYMVKKLFGNYGDIVGIGGDEEDDD